MFLFTTIMKLNSHTSLVTASLLSLAMGVQAQTQIEMEEILLPKLSPICTKQTTLIYPKWSDWWNILKWLSTCSVPLIITVLPDNTLEMNEGNSKWIGKLNANGGIQKIKDIR